MRPQYLSVVGGIPKVCLLNTNISPFRVSIRTDATLVEVSLEDPASTSPVPTWVAAPSAASNGLIFLRDPVRAVRFSKASNGLATVLQQGIAKDGLLPRARGNVLGPELVVNGDFSQGSTGWDLQAGWTVAGNQLTATTAAVNTYARTLSSVITAGKKYRIRVVCTGVIAGSWKTLLEGGANVFGDQGGAGTFTADVVATATGSLYIWANSTLTSTYSLVSVREIVN